ncbi:hypothetical protein BV25DRAFT_1854021 [Artomyces pyxidatus]|uniref:Uncharacterized protein n=1 Tax=Artomyces pyxidatus TaxID=48021 RepID=A0ACB8T4I7_9AGAM|nr:hypothetical protein BV25DRAFT_1854021 [Artomyces pyxidatus]
MSDDPHTSKTITAIYVVGPSSTGKTTLCNALAARLGLSSEVYITEVARKVMRERGFTRDDVGKVEMQRAIMEAQLAYDESARIYAGGRGGAGVVLSDRSAVDAVVYAELNDDGETGAMARTLIASPPFQAALPAYRHSLFVLLQPVAEWLVDDGVRSLEDGWRCHEAFRVMLSNLDIPHIELDGTSRWLEERVALVRMFAWK